MPETDKPTTIEAFTPDGEATVIMQTGFEVNDVTVLKIASHAKVESESVTFLVDQMKVRSHAALNSAAQLIKANNSSNAFLCTTDNDKDRWNILDYLHDLQAQGMTYVNATTKFSVPDMSASVAEITRFYDDMYNALLGLPTRFAKTDGTTAAANIGEAVQAFQWKGEGAETQRWHSHWVRRFVILLGTSWRKTLPKFNERFESMDDAQITRTVWMYLIAAIYIINDFVYVAAAQSELAVFNLGFTNRSVFSPKVPNLSTNIDKQWAYYADPKKTTEVVVSGHTQYSAAPIDTTLISVAGQQVSTSDDALKAVEVVYKMCDQAIVWGRQMFGIGRYEAREETINFAVLLSLDHGLVTDVATGLISAVVEIHTGQGTTKWFPGANLAIVQNYMEDVCEIRAKEWALALSRRKHWSYEDITVWSNTIFVDFSIKSSLMGLCEACCYKGIRSQVRFEDYAVPLVSSFFSDPSSLVSTNDMCVSPYAAGYQQPNARWGYLLIGGGPKVNKLYALHVHGDWTEQEILMDMRYGMMLGRKYHSSEVGAGDFERIWATRMRMVQLIGAYAEEKKARETITFMTSDAAEPRFESTKDVFDITNLSTLVKYSSTVVNVKPALWVIRSAARVVGEGHGLLVKYWLGFQSRIDAWLEKVCAPITIKKVDKPVNKAPETAQAAIAPPKAVNEGNNPKSDTV